LKRIVAEKKIIPAFQINLLADGCAFIKSWLQLYTYPDYDVYQSLISKPEFEYSDLLKLFQWKNGMELSGKKSTAFEQHIASQLPLINQLKKNIDRDVFDDQFWPVGAIWKIFLLHIIDPAFPIFDQHVYRAFAYLQLAEKKELPYASDLRLKIYDEQFLPFFFDLQDLAPGCTAKQIDNAL
jgi:hypothetical protein